VQKRFITAGRGTLGVGPCKTVNVVKVDGSIFRKRDNDMFPPLALNELIVCLAMFIVCVYYVVGFGTSGHSSGQR
jgi:hypothetical protein